MLQTVSPRYTHFQNLDSDMRLFPSDLGELGDKNACCPVRGLIDGFSDWLLIDKQLDAKFLVTLNVLDDVILPALGGAV